MMGEEVNGGGGGAGSRKCSGRMTARNPEPLIPTRSDVALNSFKTHTYARTHSENKATLHVSSSAQREMKRESGQTAEGFFFFSFFDYFF